MTSVAARLALGLLLASAAAGPLAAQPPAMPGRPSGAAVRVQADAVVDEVLRLIRTRYVYPERREPIAGRIEQARRSGRYRTADPAELATRLTEDLAAASRDPHLYVRFDEPGYRSALAQAAPQTPNPAQVEEDALRSRLRNHGLEEMRILDGNVRYLRISGFWWVPDETGRAYDEAMRFLRDGDAVIIDLRGNGGGASSAVQYLISHFLPARDEQLLVTFNDDETGPAQSRVLGHLPAGRLIGKPLYVLVDRSTGSAAEEVANHVRTLHLGELVGRTTSGGGANNRLFPIPPGFVFSVSLSNATWPNGGTGWDGVGVAPTIDTDPAGALDVALEHAVARLAATGPEPRRAGWRWDAETLAARRNPPSVTAADLAAFAGRYGPVTVRATDAGLMYQREGRQELSLDPLSPDVFSVRGRPGQRIRFIREGARITGIQMQVRDGPPPPPLARTS